MTFLMPLLAIATATASPVAVVPRTIEGASFGEPAGLQSVVEAAGLVQSQPELVAQTLEALESKQACTNLSCLKELGALVGAGSVVALRKEGARYRLEVIDVGGKDLRSWIAPVWPAPAGWADAFLRDDPFGELSSTTDTVVNGVALAAGDVWRVPTGRYQAAFGDARAHIDVAANERATLEPPKVEPVGDGKKDDGKDPGKGPDIIDDPPPDPVIPPAAGFPWAITGGVLLGVGTLVAISSYSITAFGHPTFDEPTREVAIDVGTTGVVIAAVGVVMFFLDGE